MSAPPIETLVVDALPDDDRTLLRHGAVLRYITRPLAEAATGSAEAAARLVEHPVVQGRADETWTIPAPLRQALLAGWDPADEIRERVSRADDGMEGRYARLSAAPSRPDALRDLAGDVGRALSTGDVPRAHDLIRLLDEWPVPDDPAARGLRDELAPLLRRHSRALRDRDATTTYLERGFEDVLWDRLVADDGRWMLHLHAPGGRGKTMFVKNLLGRRCPESDIPVARIDFDHVTQLGLATTEPWLLLLAIAAQLDPQLPLSPFGYTLQRFGAYQDIVQPEALPRVPPAGGVAPDTRRDELAVEAAREMPEKFREILAAATGGGLVVIALDTVENVLHTEGADLLPVLDMLGELFHGTGEPGVARVPGLRVVVSGRFDLAGERELPSGRRERVPGFRERWVGDAVTSEPSAGTEVLLGREVAMLEVPGFTEDEARRYLTEQGGISDPAMVRAIVARTHDNPMKLALLAEYVTRNRDVGAATIESFANVDLFYLVDRVVDRLPDEHVQWLLRWGALLPVLTREAAEEVIWPALAAFASLPEPGRDYDNAALDLGVPPPAEGVRRWPVPDLAAVRAPGAFGRAWETLLDYAAQSSWVFRVEGLSDAVSFHTEVREPLRGLLRDGGHPAYDDIHRRSYAYWSREVGTATGAARGAALHAVLFHAYQPWTGDDHDGDALFRALLARAGLDRGDRLLLARAVLDIAGPSVEVRSIAHLEIAEAVVAQANLHGTPVHESTLSSHVSQIDLAVQDREQRRIGFLRAVLAEAAGRVDVSWALLAEALPGADVALASGWLASRTPPEPGLETVRQFLAYAAGTVWAGDVARSLTLGLLAAERWLEAYEVADRADAPELWAATRMALGHAQEVLTSKAPRIWQARARLLQYEPGRVLRATDRSSAAAVLVIGQAYAQLGNLDAARDDLSGAASNSDPAVAVEAITELARLAYRDGGTDVAASLLKRLSHFSDPLVALRARLLEARLIRPGTFPAAEELAERIERMPPSVAVELAITRLVVHGGAERQFRLLRDAVAAVQGSGARLLALRALAEVRLPAAGHRPAVADELLELTRFKQAQSRTPALVLARADLARVLGDHDTAVSLLDGLSSMPDPDGAIGRAVTGARGRLGPARRGASDPIGAAADRQQDERAVPLLLRTVPDAGQVEVNVPGEQLHLADMTDALASLTRPPYTVLDEMGRVLPGRADWAADARADLILTDPEAARWPWEAARGDLPPAVLRRRRERPLAADEPRPAPVVLLGVLNERSKHGALALDELTRGYDGRTVVQPRLFQNPDEALPGGGILHVIAEPVDRRGYPALQLTTGELLTAESFAKRLTGGPWLVILDVALSSYDHDAVEQLAVANAFCWYLVRAHFEVDVICGPLSDAGRSDGVRELARRLGQGVSPAEVAAVLQRPMRAGPRNRAPWRDVVSVSTDRPDRRYRLGGPA
ncbi:hypothetical protein ACIA5D_19265 [Actinoplanes sp. NPDC051513]|uniref:hypothetical protein n=1 Tax=Actinoplanes sp. NPDC051513 TaxID=3363908 RepID=UPI0037949ED6